MRMANKSRTADRGSWRGQAFLLTVISQRSANPLLRLQSQPPAQLRFSFFSVSLSKHHQWHFHVRQETCPLVALLPFYRKEVPVGSNLAEFSYSELLKDTHWLGSDMTPILGWTLD
jgi:hypothetical protein